MKFDELLEYQKIDSALVKIERGLNSSDEKEKAAALNAKMKTASDNMSKLNAEADELIANVDKLASSIAAYEAEAEEIASHIGEADEFNEIEYYEKVLANLSEEVQKLERELIRIGNRMDYVKDNSDNLTRHTLQTNEQYKAALQAFQVLKAKLISEGRPINEKLKALEKNIPEQFIAIYKRCRANKKLPAFVEYSGDGGCVCGMNLPNDCISKLKSEGDWVECPNCGRIVLINK